jgi:hypothetical protein
MNNNTEDSTNFKKVKERHVDSSADTIRRPLSSTIDRVKEGTGSRDNDFLTSVSTQRNVEQTSHVPIIDGSVFHSRKSDVDKDLSDNDSHHSSNASLSGGYLSLGTLSKPTRTLDDTRKTARKTADLPKEKVNDKNSVEVDAYKAQSATRISLDNAWGDPQGDKERSLVEESSISINSDPSLPGVGERVSLPLDSVWKNTDAKRDSEEREKEKREREERELREREEREWEEEKRKREELRRKREEEAWEREQRELAELQREQELRERENNTNQDHAQQDKNVDEKKEQHRQEETQSSKDSAIDPVMLQYMQMIQKKKDEEDKVLIYSHPFSTILNDKRDCFII